MKQVGLLSLDWSSAELLLGYQIEHNSEIERGNWVGAQGTKSIAEITSLCLLVTVVVVINISRQVTKPSIKIELEMDVFSNPLIYTKIGCWSLGISCQPQNKGYLLC